MTYKGIFYTIISAVLFGGTPVLASWTYDLGSNPTTMVFFRNLFVIPVLLLVMLVQKTGFRITKRELGIIVAIGVFGTTMTNLLMYNAIQFIGVGTSTTLHFLYPIFVAILCRVVYKERLGKGKVLVLFIAAIGISCFIDLQSSVKMVGIVLALVSGLTYAFYMVEVEKKGLKDMNPFKLSFYLAIVAVFAVLLYNIGTRDLILNLSARVYLYSFIIAICTSFLAVVLLQLGIKYLGATTAAIFCMFEPISSVFFGWLLLGEQLSVMRMTGSAIILIGVTILILADRFGTRSGEPVEAGADITGAGVLLQDEERDERIE